MGFFIPSPSHMTSKNALASASGIAVTSLVRHRCATPAGMKHAFAGRDEHSPCFLMSASLGLHNFRVRGNIAEHIQELVVHSAAEIAFLEQ